MKKVTLTIVLAVICSLFMGLNANAQKPSLESVLPKAVLNNKSILANNYASLMTRVMKTNTQFKQHAATLNKFNSSFFDFKKISSSKNDVNESSFTDLITNASQQADNRTEMLNILNDLKTKIDASKTWNDIHDKMVAIIQSSSFNNLSNSDKMCLSHSFLFAKISYDYAVNNGLVSANGKPIFFMVIDNSVEGKSTASINSMPLGKGCYLACFLCPGISADHAWKICDGGGSVSGLVR
jgi:hypothetical protein